MLAFGIGYSLFLILFGLCAGPRWRYGGAVAVLLLAGLVGYTTWLFVGLALGYVALTAWMLAQRLPPWAQAARIAAWLVASAGLVTHAWPGPGRCASTRSGPRCPGRHRGRACRRNRWPPPARRLAGAAALPCVLSLHLMGFLSL